jgi:flagellar hook-length control protein FliK
MPQPLHHHQPAVSLPQPVDPTWQIMDPPSRSFVGPMPVVATFQTVPAVADGLAIPDGVTTPAGSGSKMPHDAVKMAETMMAAAGKAVSPDAKMARVTTADGAAQVTAQVTAQANLAAVAAGDHTRSTRAYADQPVSSAPSSMAATADGSMTSTGTGGQSSSGGGQGGGGQHQGTHAADFSAGRDASARMVVHRLNTLQTGWAGTMVRQLESGLQNGTQSIRIILQPAKLGRLNVDLGLKDGAARIRVGVETAEAAQLLKGARHQLGQMLEQSGMRLAGLQTVNTGGDHGGDTGFGHGQQGQNEQGGENAGRKQALSNKMGQPEGASPAGPDRAAPGTGEMAVLSILA